MPVDVAPTGTFINARTSAWCAAAMASSSDIVSLVFFGFGFGNGNGKEKPALTAPKFAVECDGMGGEGSLQGGGLVIWAGSADSEKLIK